MIFSVIIWLQRAVIGLHFQPSDFKGETPVYLWGIRIAQGVFAARIVSILHNIVPEAFSYVDFIYLTDKKLNPRLARVDHNFAIC